MGNHAFARSPGGPQPTHQLTHLRRTKINRTSSSIQLFTISPCILSYEIYGQILFSLRDLWLRDLWEAYEIYGSLRDLWEGLRDLWEFARFMGVTRFMGRTTIDADFW